MKAALERARAEVPGCFAAAYGDLERAVILETYTLDERGHEAHEIFGAVADLFRDDTISRLERNLFASRGQEHDGTPHFQEAILYGEHDLIALRSHSRRGHGSFFLCESGRPLGPLLAAARHAASALESVRPPRILQTVDLDPHLPSREPLDEGADLAHLLRQIEAHGAVSGVLRFSSPAGPLGFALLDEGRVCATGGTPEHLSIRAQLLALHPHAREHVRAAVERARAEERPFGRVLLESHADLEPAFRGAVRAQLLGGLRSVASRRPTLRLVSGHARNRYDFGFTPAQLLLADADVREPSMASRLYHELVADAVGGLLLRRPEQGSAICDADGVEARARIDTLLGLERSITRMFASLRMGHLGFHPHAVALRPSPGASRERAGDTIAFCDGTHRAMLCGLSANARNELVRQIPALRGYSQST